MFTLYNVKNLVITISDTTYKADYVERLEVHENTPIQYDSCDFSIECESQELNLDTELPERPLVDEFILEDSEVLNIDKQILEQILNQELDDIAYTIFLVHHTNY